MQKKGNWWLTPQRNITAYIYAAAFYIECAVKDLEKPTADYVERESFLKHKNTDVEKPHRLYHNVDADTIFLGPYFIYYRFFSKINKNAQMHYRGRGVKPF